MNGSQNAEEVAVLAIVLDDLDAIVEV